MAEQSFNNSPDPCNRCTLQVRVEERKGGGLKPEGDGSLFEADETSCSCSNKHRCPLVLSFIRMCKGVGLYSKWKRLLSHLVFVRERSSSYCNSHTHSLLTLFFKKCNTRNRETLPSLETQNTLAFIAVQLVVLEVTSFE